MYSIMMYDGENRWVQLTQTDLFELVFEQLAEMKKKHPDKQLFVFERMMGEPRLTVQFDVELNQHIGLVVYADEILAIFDKFKSEGSLR